MDADFQDYKFLDLTQKAIKAFYKVYNALGYGFLEKVYENSLLHEFKNEGIKCFPQKPIKVSYDNAIVGEYFADILVDDKLIIEIKASRKLTEENEAQLLNYLKATNIEVGLLFNFGPRPEVRRKAFDNINKSAFICENLRPI